MEIWEIFLFIFLAFHFIKVVQIYLIEYYFLHANTSQIYFMLQTMLLIINWKTQSQLIASFVILEIKIHFINASNFPDTLECNAQFKSEDNVYNMFTYQDCIRIVPTVPKNPKPHGTADEFGLKFLFFR